MLDQAVGRNHKRQVPFFPVLSLALLWAVLLIVLGTSSNQPISGNGKGSFGIKPPSLPIGTAVSTATPTFVEATSTSTPTPCPPTWYQTFSPSPSSVFNQLNGIDALAPNNVWAVGWAEIPPGQPQSLVIHWDGANWNTVTSPSPSNNAQLNAITAIAPNDIWAAGSNQDHAFVVHWNGSQWSTVSTPDPGGTVTLWHLSAIAANDVWVVGDSSGQALTMHWNGIQWSIVSSPSFPGENSYLYSIDSLASNDVWAVGYTRNISTSQYTTLALHWDGTQWNPVPNLRIATERFFSTSIYSASDVWITGNLNSYPTLRHWNGTEWSSVTVPDPGGQIRDFNTVSVIGANDAWAVGYWQIVGVEVHTFAMRCTPSGCTIVPTPDIPGSNYGSFTSVISIAPNDAWAIGLHGPLSGSRYTLVEHYSPCSSPTPTSTVSTPSPTAVVTATSCPLQFQDVPPGSTFYSFIRCLACRGIVGGYPCGNPEPCVPPNNYPYFRTNNNVTRGQLAKIVSQAAGFSDPVSGQTFEDVPEGSTFWLWIERLALHEVMSGYICGSLGEPCVPPQNRPYFRPGRRATRGQLTKIVSNAANFNDPPSGQTFEDVPPGSTFYTYTQRLTSRLIMQGYPCGGPGEPCVSPQNRPYFRPNNNVSRGQTSKIVGNAFFPSCDQR